MTMVKHDKKDPHASVTLHHDVEVTADEPKKQGFWRKLWWFIWEDNSFASWLVNIALAFIIIKFLVYPGLGYALGTHYPIVAVVSGSMEHDGSFNQWWDSNCVCNGASCTTQEDLYQQYNLTHDVFDKFKFPNGFNKGDLMVLVGPKNVEVGDVVVFGVQGLSDPVIHRVVALEDGSLTTKGDHNCGLNPFEEHIPNEFLVGKAALRVPYLGWIKLLAVDLFNLILGRA
jgi:signal peptidase I